MDQEIQQLVVDGKAQIFAEEAEHQGVGLIFGVFPDGAVAYAEIPAHRRGDGAAAADTGVAADIHGLDLRADVFDEVGDALRGPGGKTSAGDLPVHIIEDLHDVRDRDPGFPYVEGTAQHGDGMGMLLLGEDPVQLLYGTNSNRRCHIVSTPCRKGYPSTLACPLIPGGNTRGISVPHSGTEEICGGGC